MSDIVIKSENLGKKYLIGHQAETARYVTLRDMMMRNARALWNKTKNLAKGKPIINGDTLEEVWALKDVSFEIKRGEAVGIIGRNGAGKSTLLKILSRITEPSIGRVSVSGRIASLLEVGTGFHPELTGRENIYLNGAILGMTRAEIKQRFDEIVSFAEVEKFLDTPVKRYSSGMYVRLAFAVAAHLEPEILVVDEVLAVGDAEFQKKCLGKMEGVTQQGRTILFVSHNMSAITRLCTQSIWLEGGEIKEILPSGKAVAAYLESNAQKQSEIVLTEDKNKDAQYLAIRILNSRMIPSTKISCEESFSIQLTYIIRKKDSGIYFAFYLQNAEGLKIIFSDSRDDSSFISFTPGMYQSSIEIPSRLLAPGQYFVTAGIATMNGSTMLDHRPQVCSFSLYEPTSLRGDNRPGLLGFMFKWDTHEYSLLSTNGGSTSHV